MPQDSLRSRIYKSLLTCNDPKGIVDSSSTVRIQKVASSEMEKRIKSKTRRNSYESLDCKFQQETTSIRGLQDEFDSSSSFQLKEVSKGAQKLKQTIDLWSNEAKYDTKTEKIARDLFDGALELQESLAILGKLQKASWYMTQDKKKEWKERKTENTDMERTHLQRSEFQKPRLSADYSYGNGAEELKKMIRDRLSKQILLSNTTNSAEKTCFPKSNTENLASEIASTSSSQSSIVYTTVGNPEKKGGGKNMIAKLMGLELQSVKMQEILHKQFHCKKISDHQRLKFNMELAEAEKPKSVAEKIEGRNSESGLETKKFKSILKNSAKETDHYFNHSSYSHSREELTHNALPIVLLKPLHVSQVEMEECQEQLVFEDEASNKRQFAKLKMKKKHPQKTNENRAEALISEKVHGSVGAEETAFTRIYHKKEAQNPKEENWKPKECVGVNKSKKRAPHIPLNQNLQRKEAIDKEVLQSQKYIATKIVPTFQEQVQRPCRKLQTNLNTIEEPISRDSISSPDTVSEWSSMNRNQAVKEKVINEVTVDKSVVIKCECQDEDKKPDQTNSPTSLLHMTAKSGGSKPQIYGNFANKYNFNVEPCSELQTEEEACKNMNHGIADRKTETNPKSPISHFPSTDYANELLHLNVNGNSSKWISQNEPTLNNCDALDFGTNYRKIKEESNGVSGLGCKALESMAEAEEIVEDLEKNILSGLIQEVFS